MTERGRGILDDRASEPRSGDEWQKPRMQPWKGKCGVMDRRQSGSLGEAMSARIASPKLRKIEMSLSASTLAHTRIV